MKWKYRFASSLTLLLLVCGLSGYKIYNMNREVNEIKRENKVLTDKLQVIESVFEETQVNLKNKDVNNEKLKEELKRTKNELEEKTKEVTTKKEEMDLLVLQETSDNEGVDKEIAQDIVNTAPYIDKSAGNTDFEIASEEEANANIRQRDDFSEKFEAEHGRQPTSGEIQAQWSN